MSGWSPRAWWWGVKVFSAGSAASSPVLSQLRADLLRRTVVRSAHPTASFGAAILAAGTVLYGGDLTAAIRGMTRISESYTPESEARKGTKKLTNFSAPPAPATDLNDPLNATASSSV